jgi:type II secretory pathway pseudopilin PulG
MFLINHKYRQMAFTLVELLLTIAVAMGIAAVIYRQYSIAEANSKTAKETSLAGELTTGILRTYSGAANFSDLSTVSAINDGLVPKEMVGEDGVSIINHWGGTISLSGTTISGDPGRGFSIVYTNVPDDACLKLVKQVAGGGQFDVALINARQAMTGRHLDIAGAAQDCEGGSSTIDLRYTRGNPGQGGGTLTPCTAPSVPENRTAPCQAGYTGTMEQQRAGTCPGPYSAVYWSDWQTVSDNCQITCSVDPRSPQTRPASCPTGYIGASTEERTSSCPQGVGSPGGAVWGGWSIVSSTCQAVCQINPASPESRPRPCPYPQTGQVIETRTSYCPAITGLAAWNGWIVTSGSCNTPAVCTPRPSQTQNYARPARCPPGQVNITTGGHTFIQAQSCIITYTCPSTSGALVASTCPSPGATWTPNAFAVCGAP